jgi:quinol monooxygenase YgiN
MSGVKVTLSLKVKPEIVEGFCAALPDKITETTQRPGFRDLCIVRHATDPTAVMFIETWDSEQAYHDYIQWRTERGEMERLTAISMSPPQLDFWPVTVVDA